MVEFKPALEFGYGLPIRHLDIVDTPLIQRLRAIARKWRAWVVFAAALVPYFQDDTITDDEAVRRGIAMRVDGVPVQWSWQTLELRQMGTRVVIENGTAYVQRADGTVDRSFGSRRIDDRSDRLNHVLAYRTQMGLLGNAASADDGVDR
jgi:hypothetical protein